MNKKEIKNVLVKNIYVCIHIYLLIRDSTIYLFLESY